MFKYMVLAVILLCASPSSLAWAQTKSVDQKPAATTAPKNETTKKPSVDQRDYNLMQSTYDSCRSSPQNSQYRCDCAAVTFMDKVRDQRSTLLRQGLDDKQVENRLYPKMDFIKSDAYRQCINREAVAVSGFGQCLDWALKSRDDYREFCGCYAMRYADMFTQAGMSYFNDPASTMASAMISCNRELQRR